MRQWILRFWEEEGKRIFYMTITSVFGVGFIITGVLVEELDALVGAGTTLLIGVATLANNKSRGSSKNGGQANGKNTP